MIYNVYGSHVGEQLGFNSFLHSHGNYSRSKDVFTRTRLTVRSRMAQVGKNVSPKKVLTIVTNEYGGIFNAKSHVDVPRNRKQFYNQSKHIKKNILAYIILIPNHI